MFDRIMFIFLFINAAIIQALHLETVPPANFGVFSGGNIFFKTCKTKDLFKDQYEQVTGLANKITFLYSDM